MPKYLPQYGATDLVWQTKVPLMKKVWPTFINGADKYANLICTDRSNWLWPDPTKGYYSQPAQSNPTHVRGLIARGAWGPAVESPYKRTWSGTWGEARRRKGRGFSVGSKWEATTGRALTNPHLTCPSRALPPPLLLLLCLPLQMQRSHPILQKI